MSGIFLTYSWYGKWVDIFQVYVGILIYGIFQEYVRISNFYGFQMKMLLNRKIRTKGIKGSATEVVTSTIEPTLCVATSTRYDYGPDS
jgi:hypothetical protein